jgi:hypothetical protein
MKIPAPIVLLFAAHGAFSQPAGLPSSENLTYRVEWRLITAGRARLEWNTLPRQSQPEYQAKLRLESVGLVSKLFKVENDYSAVLNQNLCAVSAQATSHEGSRARDTRVAFDYAAHKASYLEKDLNRNAVVASQEAEVPSCVHDVIGGLYYLRTLNLEPGQSATAPVSDGKKSVMARIEAQQRENITVPDGSYKTIRYELFLFDNVLYRRSAHLYVWLSDDRRKLPVQIRVKMQITTGTITLELEKHE